MIGGIGPERRHLAYAGAILVVALALRVHDIGAQELWLDEAFSFNEIAAPDWLTSVRMSEPPLYPVALHLWSGVAGTGEAAMRLPSAVFGTGFVAAVIWAGWELFDPAVALWSGVVAATSPIQVYYSQEARAYALLAMVLACTCALVARAVRTNRWGDWALVAVAVAAAPHTHYLAAFALAPTVAIVALAPGPGRLWRYVAAVAAGLLLFAPWFVWSFVMTAHSYGGLDWIRPVWELTPPWQAIPKSLEILYLGSHKGFVPIAMKQFDSLESPLPLRVLGIATLSLLGLWLAVPWGRRGPREARAGAGIGVLWALLLVPILTLWTISLLKPIYVVGRYDQLALPAFPLLVGLGLARIRAAGRFGRALALGTACMLLLPVGATLARYYRGSSTDIRGHRATAAALARRVHAGDLVIFSQPRGYPVTYQLAQLGYQRAGGFCEDRASGKRFACQHYPRTLGPMLTAEDLRRVVDRADVVGLDVDTVYLPALAGADNEIYLALDPYGVEGGNIMISQRDRMLLQVLAERGFRPLAIDTDLGVAHLGRAGRRE